MAETIVARFEVTGWDPSAIEGLNVDWIGAIIMRKTFTEGMRGESIAHFVSSGTEESGRGYLAIERISGNLDDGRSGTVTVHHGALQHPDDASAFGWIVPGTGTGDFANWTGAAKIHHDDRGASFVFTLA